MSYWDKVTQNRVGRRRLLKGGASLSMGAAALALIGCGSDDDDGDSGNGGSGDNGGSNGGGEPKAGGTLRFGMTVDLTSLEPHVIILAHRDSINQVWEPLTHYDENLQPQPQLAESWDINDDYTEITMHLRQDVKFHSGRELKADDIVFNWQRVTAPDTAFGQLRAMGTLYDSVEATDDYTVVFKSAIPRPASFDFFENFLIGDKDTLDKDPTVAIGTGPFKLGEWRPGDQFNLLKNPDYYISGKPLLDEQVYSVGLDDQTMLAQFEADALDIAIRPSIRDFVRYREDSNYQTLVHPSAGAYYVMGWNSVGSGGSPEVFKDKRVRQALNYAIDRRHFAETILAGTVDSYSLPWTPSSIAYDADLAQHYTYDIEKAKAMLAEAGVGELEFDILKTGGNPELDEMALVYQNDLAKLGIKINIQVLEVAAFVDKINADPPNYNGMWIVNGSYSNLAAPITMINLSNVFYGTTKVGELDGVPYGDNNTGYYSDEWAAVIDAINKEGDEDKLKQLYSEMNDLFIDESWMAFLAPKPPRIALRGNVRDVKWYAATDGFYFTDTWLA